MRQGEPVSRRPSCGCRREDGRRRRPPAGPALKFVEKLLPTNLTSADVTGRDRGSEPDQHGKLSRAGDCRSGLVTTDARLPACWAEPVWRAAGQHRVIGLQELRGEQVHEDPVVAAAHGQPRAAAAPHLAEAHLGVDPDRPLVPRGHREHDVVQAEDAEASVEGEPGRLGAQPVAAPLAQVDPELGGTVAMVDVKQRADADRAWSARS